MSMSHNNNQQSQQTQWQPPVPSHASLPVDRTKTEPKPAFYKLQFGDDLTGFSYYVRTLTVVIGRNVASLVPQLPPDRLNGIDEIGDGKGGILPPPDERNLGGPTIPPLDESSAALEMLVDAKPVLSELDLQGEFGSTGLGDVFMGPESVDLVTGLEPTSTSARAVSTGNGNPTETSTEETRRQDLLDVNNLEEAFLAAETAKFESTHLGIPDRTRAVSETEVEVKLEHLDSVDQDVPRSKSFDHADFANPPAISMHDLEISDEALNQAVADISYGDMSDNLASNYLGGDPSMFALESPGLSPAALESLALAATSTSPPPPPPPPPAHTASDSLEHVDVDLGPLKSVSRNHAKISYLTDLGHFCLEIYGRNGAWVDDRYFVRGSIVPLNQGSQIQIATRIFSFILPPSPGSSPYNTPYDSYSIEELPYPYNLPAQDVGYQEFYGEGGPGPSSAAALATRFPEQYNVFTAPDGHGLGLAMDSHGWLNDWSDRSGDHSEASDSDSDSDSDEDEDEEDYDEDEESDEESSEEEVVQEKPKPIPKIRIKVKRPPRPESDLSSVSSAEEQATPVPPTASKPGTSKAKAVAKKGSPQKTQQEAQPSQPPLAAKQPAKSKKQVAAKGAKGKAAAVKDESMDVDPKPPAPEDIPMTLANVEMMTAAKASEEPEKGKETDKEKEKDKDGKVKAVPEKAKEKDKPKPKTEKAKSTPAKKESKKKSKATAIAPAPGPLAPAPGPPPIPTLASATASMPGAQMAGPLAPPPATTLAAVEALHPGPPPVSAPMPVRPLPPPPPPPHPQQQMNAQVRPPPPTMGPIPGPMGPAHVRPPVPMPPQASAGPSTPAPAPPHPIGQPVPPTTPQVARPPVPGPVRPPITTTPSSSNTGTPEPMKPFVLTELIETPGRAGHILVNVPIPPSGAGPRPPPGPLIGLDAQPFIGPPPLKPTSTFATIIHRALLFLPRGRGTLGEVCNWVAGEWEWFRLNIDAGWQNSIRHNLSLNKAFLKVPRIPEDDPESKGSVWIIDPKEGPKFEEKQRKDAMKAEGKGKNSDVRREKERIRVEERQKKLRDMPHDHPSNSQGPSQSSSSSSQHHPNQQQGSYQQRPLPGSNSSHSHPHSHAHPHAHAQHPQQRPIAATSVRPTPRPVSTQSTTGISKGLPAKGKIAVTITPITAMLRQKSVIATTDQNGKALPFTCDGSTLSLDQQTFGHLTADILEKLTVLGPAQAVEVISAWVINKNKQMAAASAGKASAAGAGSGAGTAGRPPSAGARPLANGTTTQGQTVRPGGSAGNATRPPPARPASAQGGAAVRPPATSTATNGVSARPPAPTATGTTSGSAPATSGPANPNSAPNPKPSTSAPTPNSATNTTSSQSSATTAAAAPATTGPTTMTIKGKVIGPAPPGASLTRVISMIAEVANAKGDVNIVGPNASALLRYIRVVGVDIDLKVADRIWATGVLPPLPMKKGQGVNGAKQTTGNGGMKPPVTAAGAKPSVPASVSTPASASASASAPVLSGAVSTLAPNPTAGVKRKLESPTLAPAPSTQTSGSGPVSGSGSGSGPTGNSAATGSSTGPGVSAGTTGSGAGVGANGPPKIVNSDMGPSEMKKPKLETAGGS